MTTALETLKQLRGKYLGDGIRSLKVDDLLVEIEAYATEQVAQYKQDAERYRWLRNESIDQWSHPIVVEQQRLEHGMRYVGPLFKSSLDNKIDAAIRARAQEE